MTLPRTHPLHGAVEALDNARDITISSGVLVIRALEAAGYRVVGPEPTEAMEVHVNQTLDFFLDGVPLKRLIQEAIAAAPTITETENGDV